MFIQAGSHYVVQPGFELKDILLPQHIPSATITGICDHAQPRKSNPNGCCPYNKKLSKESRPSNSPLNSEHKSLSTAKHMLSLRENPFSHSGSTRRNIPCPSIVFLRVKVAPSPFPDRWMQIPRNWLVFPLAYGSAVVTRSMLPTGSEEKQARA